MTDTESVNTCSCAIESSDIANPCSCQCDTIVSISTNIVNHEQKVRILQDDMETTRQALHKLIMSRPKDPVYQCLEDLDTTLCQKQSTKKNKLAQVAHPYFETDGVDIETLTSIQTKASYCYNNINALETDLATTQVHPFNPECFACRQQPWRLYWEHLGERLLQAQAEYDDLQNKLTMGLGPYDSLSALENDTSLKYELKLLDQDLELIEKERDNTQTYEAWVTETKDLQIRLDHLETEYKNNVNMISNLKIKEKQYRVARISCLNKSLTKMKEVQTILLDGSNWIIENKKVVLFEAWCKDVKAIETYVSKKQSRGQELSQSKHDVELEKSEKRSVLDKQIVQANKDIELFELIREKHFDFKRLSRDKVCQSSHYVDQQVSEKMAVAQLSNIESFADLYISYQELLTKIKDKLCKLEKVYELLSSYQHWVYKEVVMPSICACTNQLLTTLCDVSADGDMRIALSYDICPDDSFQWLIETDTGRLPIQKSSGFQLFVISLALRVALGRLVLTHTNALHCKHLFIDEGFTACDEYNLYKVPQFLQSLITSRVYNNIVLVSHLDHLKACADTVIHIQQVTVPNKSTNIKDTKDVKGSRLFF